jgi:hypothetical protein
MTNPNTDQLVTITVHNITASGAGFGVILGTGANCIIPSRVVYAAALEVGALVRCKVIDNPSDEFRYKTPYMVAYVDPMATVELHRAMHGGAFKASQPEPVAPAPTQLELPIDAPAKPLSDLQLLLSDWDAEDDEDASVVEPAPTPATRDYSAADLKVLVNEILDTGGLMTLAELRDAVWPDEDFGSGDPRYNRLVNSVRDMHAAALITAFGRRYSAKGNLAGIQYTKFPERVSIVWAGSEGSK